MCNSCQKHSNHHCVHHHQCSRHTSQEKLIPAKPNSAARLLNKKYKAPLAPIDDNEECNFTFKPAQKHTDLATEQLSKQLQQREKQVTEAQQLSSAVQCENRKLKQKNNHLESQMEYLRTQLDTLVSNHNVDIKEEIKKHLLENKDLNLTIHKLSSQLADTELTLEQMEKDVRSYRISHGKIEKQEISTSQKYEALSHKHRELVENYQALTTKSQKNDQELKKITEKYTLLAKSLSSQEKNSHKTKNKEKNRLQKMERELQSVKRSQTIESKLFLMEKTKMTETIDELHQKINRMSKELNSQKEKNKNFQSQNDLLKDDLKQSKKIILKFEELKSKYPATKNAGQGDIVDSSQQQKVFLTEDENKTLQKLPANFNNENHQFSADDMQSLSIENVSLRQKISRLQSDLTESRKNAKGSKLGPSSTIINEQLILKIGASDEFRKIVNEKNLTIKNLMREKNELYAKIHESSYGQCAY